MADAAATRNFYIEAYHCAFEPHRIDHLVIPELSTAIINSMEPHYFSRPEACREIDAREFAPKLPRALQEEKRAFRLKYQSTLSEAVTFLTRAKAVHDELEELYIPNMDFAKIDSLCRETLQRTLNFACIAG